MEMPKIAMIKLTNKVPLEGIVEYSSCETLLNKRQDSNFANLIKCRSNDENLMNVLPFIPGYDHTILFYLRDIFSSYADEYKCAIIDNLANYLHEVESIDTKIVRLKDPVVLTNNTRLLICRDYYEELSEDEKNKLNSLYQIEVVDESLKAAINQEIANNYSMADELYYELIDQIKQNYGLSISFRDNETDAANLLVKNYYISIFINSLMKNLPEIFSEEEIQHFSSNSYDYENKLSELARKVCSNDNVWQCYCKFVQAYNKRFIELKNQGKLLSTEQIQSINNDSTERVR